MKYSKTVTHTWELGNEVNIHVFDNNQWISITEAGDDPTEGTYYIPLNDNTCAALEAILSLYRNSQSED